mmetsp:Transcript_22944/g.56532  ORF Transcript_22944/g.56532 Transcript_22944/m.56532 type:complete len:617 (-) Transcript_22944:13-1863(-)
MLLDLPNDAMRSVALHLDAPDVLSLLSTHREFQDSIGKSATFWGELIARDFDLTNNNGDGEQNHGHSRRRQEYLTKAYIDHLPAAQWYPIRRIPSSTVSSREGHLACVLPGPDNEQRVIITGGFTEDATVYMMRIPSRTTTNPNTSPTSSSSWPWTRIMPGYNSRPSFSYGASLTALDATVTEDGCHVARAIRFGGFMSGGYSNEVNQVWVMTVRSEPNKDCSSSSNDPWRTTYDPWRTSVSWELVPTHNPQCGAPRAYHTATLIAGRYLVVLGGMMWRESILGEAILDTQTWTWMNNHPISTFGDEKPSGRHGHSVILDNRRNRLLLFGGGSGTDLLRSGRDNSEVWEFKMNNDWETNVVLPWTWSKLHNDTCGGQSDSSDDDDEDEDNGEDYGEEEGADATMQARSSSSPPLSPAEALCIGRCHHGIKVTPNTAVFLFGSGRPSTNHVIGYDLRKDCFLRPTISGPLPTPRFSGVAVYLESEGYLMTQGGYSSQQSDCIDDLSILDLAPFMKQQRDFTSLPVDNGRRPHREITDNDAQNGRMNRYGGNMLEQHQFMTQIISMTRGGLVTAEELEELLASRGIVSNNGVVLLGGGADYSEDDDDDDDDDEDYVED